MSEIDSLGTARGLLDLMVKVTGERPDSTMKLDELAVCIQAFALVAIAEELKDMRDAIQQAAVSR